METCVSLGHKLIATLLMLMVAVLPIAGDYVSCAKFSTFPHALHHQDGLEQAAFAAAPESTPAPENDGCISSGHCLLHLFGAFLLPDSGPLISYSWLSTVSLENPGLPRTRHLTPEIRPPINAE